MNTKASKKKKQSTTYLSPVNVLSPEELSQKIEALSKDLQSHTWRDLETHGKFIKNDKISFISDDMLVVGCDIGSDTHYIRAIDSRGIELSKKAFPFENNADGFEKAKEWMLRLAALHGKKQIVLGLEPTGHYWFCVATWLIANGISVVQVNPYAVKQTKEVEDNSQLKDDRKDPKLIANLVKDGNYGMPYLPEGIYQDLRDLSLLKDQLTEDRNRSVNRLHRLMKIQFPEYKDAFGKIDGTFALELIKRVSFPEKMVELGTAGIQGIWHEAKLRGRGYSNASTILEYAGRSVGLKRTSDCSDISAAWWAAKVQELDAELKLVEAMLEEKVMEIPHAEKVMAIPGIGKNILAGMLAQIGDITRFDDAKEIQKLAGMGLVACSSGKHKGETKISHRGRKRLRFWGFHGGRCVVLHSEEFKELFKYYTTRPVNQLTKMETYILLACKLIRVIFAILKDGAEYDPKKMMSDIKRNDTAVVQAA